MANKALISTLTWRSLEMQKEEFSDVPCFVAPDEIKTLLRPTRRKDRLYILVMSLAVIADNEKDFKEFWRMLPKESSVCSKEDNCEYPSNLSINEATDCWKDARRNGAAKIGGRVSAHKRKEQSKEAVSTISEDWPKPSEEHSTEDLLRRAGVCYNTAIKYLGKRPIAQYNYQAAQKRKARKEAGRV